MKEYCLRLKRGDDLKESITRLCNEKRIVAGVVLSAVGCVEKARLRDATGVDTREVDEHMEIVSLTGTVSSIRSHLHISLSKRDLSVIGGHLVEGCIINTTCELVVGALEEYGFGVEQDASTGYDEIVFIRRK